jgi:hypothetical protein
LARFEPGTSKLWSRNIILSTAMTRCCRYWRIGRFSINCFGRESAYFQNMQYGIGKLQDSDWQKHKIQAAWNKEVNCCWYCALPTLVGLRKIPSSNLGPKPAYYVWGFSVILSVLVDNYKDTSSKNTTISFHICSNSLFTDQTVHVIWSAYTKHKLMRTCFLLLSRANETNFHWLTFPRNWARTRPDVSLTVVCSDNFPPLSHDGGIYSEEARVEVFNRPVSVWRRLISLGLNVKIAKYV